MEHEISVGVYFAFIEFEKDHRVSRVYRRSIEAYYACVAGLERQMEQVIERGIRDIQL